MRVTRALLDFGANPCLTFDGISVLASAAETGHRGLVELLGAAVAKWVEERGEEPGEEGEGRGEEGEGEGEGGGDEEGDPPDGSDGEASEDSGAEAGQPARSVRSAAEEAASNLAAYKQAIQRLR